MIFYKLIDGIYEPTQFGYNIVPTENYDKVIQVPEEIAHQAYKFDFDGETLKRKEGEYVMSLEEYEEYEKQGEIATFGTTNPFEANEAKRNQIKIEF